MTEGPIRMSPGSWADFLRVVKPATKPETVTKTLYGIPFVVDARVPPWAIAIMADPVSGDAHVMLPARRTARFAAEGGGVEFGGEAWTLRGVALKAGTCFLSLTPIAIGDFIYAPADLATSKFPDARIQADAIAEIRISFLKRPEA